MSASSSRPKSLATGVRVSGPFVKLGGNPRGHKPRVHQKIFGIVVCAAGEHKYNVRFENDTEQVCFSTSMIVESHDIGIPLEEVMPSLPMAQQEKAQEGVEDAEEEEDNYFLDILAGVDEDALPADCNIENDQYDDLFGHQEEFLQKLRGGSRSLTNNLWLNTPAANAAATTTTTIEEDAVVPADDAEDDYSTPIENPGLNTGGGHGQGSEPCSKTTTLEAEN
jgi:hypothetical protein